MRRGIAGSALVGPGSYLRNLALAARLPAMHLAAAAAVLFVSVFLCPAMVQATTYTWTNAGTDWATAADWGPVLAVPGSADVGWFNSGSYSGSQPNLAQTNSIGGLWSTGAGALSIGGTTLTLNGATINGNANTGIEMDFGAGAMTVSAPIALANASLTWLNNSANALTLSSPVNFQNGTILTIAGTGTVNITGPFTGTTTALASQGIVINGTSGGTAGVGVGQLVVLTGSNTYNGQTQLNAGTLQIGNGGSGEAFNSNVVSLGVGTTLAFSHSDNLAITGLVIGQGGLTKTGVGVLTLGSTGAASSGLTSGLTYSGPTLVSQGTLQMAAGVSNLPISVALNTSNVAASGGATTFLGGALGITSTNSGLWNNGQGAPGGYFTYVEVPTNQSFNVAAHITNVAGQSTNGALNTGVRAGPTAISAQFGAGTFSGALGISNFISVSSWETVQQQTFGERYGTGNGDSGNDASRGDQGTESGPNWLQLSYNAFNSGGNSSMQALSNSAASTSATPPSSGYLTGDSAFTAQIRPSFFPYMYLGIADNADTSTGTAAAFFNNVSQVFQYSPVTINSGAALDLNGGTQAVASLSGAGTVTNNGSNLAVLMLTPTTSSTTFSGTIQDGPTNKVTLMVGGVAGQGIQYLSGNNTYSGGTVLLQGTLNPVNANSLPGTISFAGGVLQASAGNTTDYSPQFSTAANQAYTEDTNGQSVTWASALTSSGGSLTKIGAGMLTLTNYGNTYNGGTAVTQGTLQVGTAVHPSSIGSGPVSVGPGGTLVFSPGSDGVTLSSLLGSGNVVKQGTSLMTVPGLGLNGGIATISGGTVALTASNLPQTSNFAANGSTGNSAGSGTFLGTPSISNSETIVGSGSGVAQAGEYTYITVPTNENFDVSVYVASQVNVATWSKAGILAINSLSTNANTPGTAIFATTQKQVGMGEDYETTTGDFISGFGNNTSDWIRLVYTASTNTFSGYYSTNAANSPPTSWTPVANFSAVMTGPSFLLGLYDNNVNTGSNATPNTAVFNNLTGLFKYPTAAIAHGATLDLGGNNQALTALADAATYAPGGGGLVTNNSTNGVLLTLMPSAGMTSTYSGSIQEISSGTIGLVMAGPGTQVLAGNNTFTGGTTLVSGVLSLGTAGALLQTGNQTTGLITFQGGTLQMSSANTYDYSPQFNQGVVEAYSLDTNGQNVTWASSLAAQAGSSLTKIGAGTLTLTNLSLYSGPTTINAGTVAFSPGSGNSVTMPGAVSGAGTLQVSSGSLVLQGALTQTGPTYLLNNTGLAIQNSAGAPSTSVVMSTNSTLDLTGFSSGSGTLGSLADAAGSPSGSQVLLNGNTLYTGKDNTNTTFSGAISGSGGNLNKIGSGMFTYAGNASGLTGTVSVASGGTLQMGTGAADASLGASSLANSGALIYNVATSQTAAYPISGAGTLRKTGPGTLVVSANDGYTGATTINNGTMQLSGGTLSNTSVSVLGGNLQVAANGQVSAASAVTVASGGTVSITDPSAALSSGTITLQPNGVLNAPIPTPGFQLGAGQTLTAVLTTSPGPSIVGNMTVASGAMLNVGSGTQTGTLMACNGGSTLSLSGGTVSFNVTSTPTSSGGTNSLIDPTNLALSGITTLDLNAVNLALGSGTYNLIDYSSLASGGTANLSLNLMGVSLGAIRQSFNLATTPNAVDLVVNGAPGNITWTGSVNSNWNVGTQNWSLSGSATQFYNNDLVTFSDGAHTSSVAVAAAVSPGSVTFTNNSSVYTLTGSGNIGGSGGLTVNGAGTVVLANSGGNDYIGATALNSGVLVLGNSNSVHNSAVSLSGGSLEFLPGVGTFNIGSLSGGALALSNTAGGAVTASLGATGLNSTLTGPITGPGGIQAAGGTTTISGNNSYSGTTTVTAGTILLASSNAVAGSTVAPGVANGIAFQSGIGTFNVGGLSGAGGMSLLDTAGAGIALSVGGNNQSTQFTGTLSGSGSLVKVGNGELSLAGGNIGYTGNTTVSTGTLQFYDAANFSNGTNPANTISIASGAVLEMYVDTSGSAGNYNNQILGTSGTTTISGAGTFRKTGNGQLGASGADLGALNIAMSSGGLIDLEGGTFQNGGWQAATWTSNSASMNIAAGASLDVWDGQPVYVNGLSGSGTVTNGYGGNSNGILHVGVANSSSTFAGVIQNPFGTVSLVKAGAGVQVLTGSNTYTGATTVNGGTLQIGNGGSGESIANTSIVGVAAGATVVFNHSDNTSVAGPISVAGSMIKQGPGTLTVGGLENGGNVVVSAGTLAMSASNLPTDVNLSKGGTGGGNSSIIGNLLDINGNGSGDIYNGTLVGHYTYVTVPTSQPFDVAVHITGMWGGDTTNSKAGILALSSVTASTGAFVAQTTGDRVIAENTGNTSQSSSGTSIGPNWLRMQYLGDGTTFNLYENPSTSATPPTSGWTLIATETPTINSPTMLLGIADASKNSSYSLATFDNVSQIFSYPTVQIAPGAVMDLAGNNQQIGGLVDYAPGSSGPVVDSVGGATLTLSPTGTSLYSGSIQGAMNLTVNGVGTQILAGANPYYNQTTVNAGTLQIGNGGTTGSLDNTYQIVTNATIAYHRSDNITVSTQISGYGGVTQMGPGALTLTGYNTYTSVTNISGGTLQLGDGTTDPNMTTSGIVNQAKLVYDVANSQTAGYAISGSGSVTVKGPGTLTVTGSSSYTGPTFIQGSTVKVQPPTPGGTIAVSGFGVNGTGWTLNGAGGDGPAVVSGNTLYISDGYVDEARSAFYSTQLPINVPFTASFIYQDVGARPNWDDGATFCIQSSSGTALGANSGGLGYSGIANSVAVALNIHRNGSLPSVGTTFATEGFIPAYQTTGGVDISNGDPIQVQISYDGQNNVTETLTDLTTNATWSQVYSQNIAAVLGSTSAWVGFTGSTGNSGNNEQITDFSISNVTGLSPYTHLTISSGGTLDLRGATQTLAGLSSTDGQGSMVLLDSGALTVGDSTSTTFDGSITSASGVGGELIKQGTGTLTLTGTSNYLGGTFVESGTLIATNSEAIEDGTNLYVGSANELSLFGGVVPAEAGSPASAAIAAPAASAVPEPGTLALLTAAGALLLRRRKRR